MASEIQLLAPPQGANAAPGGQAPKGVRTQEGGAFGLLMQLAVAALGGMQPEVRLQAGTGLEADVAVGQQTESGDGAGPVETQETSGAGVETGGDVKREVSSGQAEPASGPASQALVEAMGCAAQLTMAGMLSTQQGGQSQQYAGPTLTGTPGGATLQTGLPEVAAVAGGQEWLDGAMGQGQAAALSGTLSTVQPEALNQDQARATLAGASSPASLAAQQNAASGELKQAGSGQMAEADDVVALVRATPEPQTAPAVTVRTASRALVAIQEPKAAQDESVEDIGDGEASASAFKDRAGQPVLSSGTPAGDLAQPKRAASATESKDQGAPGSEDGRQGTSQEVSAAGNVQDRKPQRSAGAGVPDAGVRETTLPEAARESVTTGASTAAATEAGSESKEQGLSIRDARALSETLLQESLKRLPRNVEIRIDPPEIGKVTVLLSQRGQDVTVKFVAGTGEAQRMLADAAGDLSKALSEKGLELVGFAVDPGADGGARNAGGDAGKPDNRRYPHPSRMREVGEVPARSPYAYLSSGGFDRLA